MRSSQVPSQGRGLIIRSAMGTSSSRYELRCGLPECCRKARRRGESGGEGVGVPRFRNIPHEHLPAARRKELQRVRSVVRKPTCRLATRRLDTIAEVVASTPLERFVAIAQAARRP